MNHHKAVCKSLDERRFLRRSVRSCEVVEIGARHVLLQTTAIIAAYKSIHSADSAMLDQVTEAGVGESVNGCYRLDVVADDSLRLRYAEGGEVPANETRMVVGELPPPADCAVVETDGGLRITTPAMCVHVTLNPFRIVIEDAGGRRVCAIGGPEKNYFNNWDAHNCGVHRRLGDNAAFASECFDLRPGECIYGLGERFTGLDLVGQHVALDLEDALGATSPRAYKCVPFHVSTRGYGVFCNHSALMHYWVGALSACDLQVAVDDDFLDYYVFTGSIRHILGRYTALTGRGTLPPRWSFGYWQSKISYQSAEETLEIAREMRAHAFPCDVIHLDTHWFERDWYCNLEFDRERFPDPASWMAELRDMGFHVSLWQLPYIPEGSRLFEELLAVGGFVTDAGGGLAAGGQCLTSGHEGRVGIIDFTHPAAVRIYQAHLKRLFELGAAVIKTDFGEWAPVDGIYHDGTPGHRMHNLYPLLYNQVASEVTRRATGSGVVWARSAWAGSQRYPIHWGGDNSPNTHNLHPQLCGGLSLGLSGFTFWSQDIGGFLGETHDRLLVRWMQIGMFLSHSRIHGAGNRELYRFGADCQKMCRAFINLRYRLLPYIYSESIRCLEAGLPLARPLVLDFQDDPTTHHIDDCWLFGDSLLVAPVLEENDRRRIYFPAGRWTDWWRGGTVDGPCWLEVDAPLDRIPLYIREGGIIPLGPEMQYVDEKPTDTLELRLGLLRTPGERRFDCHLAEGRVRFRYRFDGTEHRLEHDAEGIEVRCDPADVVALRLN